MKVFFNKLFSDQGEKMRKIFYLSICAITVLLTFLLSVAPFCTYPVIDEEMFEEVIVKMLPIQAFNLPENVNTVVEGIELLSIIMFALIMIATAGSIVLLAIGAVAIFKKETRLITITKILIIFATIFSLVYVLASIVIPLICRIGGANIHTATSFVPFIFMLVIDLIYALFAGARYYYGKKFKAEYEVEQAEKEGKKDRKIKTPKDVQSDERKYVFNALELLIYLAVIAGLAVFASLTNIITVSYSVTGGFEFEATNISGLDFFKNYVELEQNAQVICYILFAMLAVMGTLIFLTFISFFSKSKTFSRLSLVTIIFSMVVCLFVGMFGKYYQIIQKINDGLIKSLMDNIVGADQYSYDYTIKSNSFYFFVASVAVVGVLIFRRPYSKLIALEKEQAQMNVAGTQEIEGKIEITDLPEDLNPGAVGVASVGETAPTKIKFADPCPAFTELDQLIPEFNKDLEVQKASLFDQPTLPKLVQFIVNYARDSRLHLSYTQEDIATFVAGLGTTKLTILQGMSGTGKTSLPKIFAEALMSKCEIVEVESSWRDKNELLGYYNEFSKTYTPKKFTQALYRAKLNPETLTFIVLDEMNLSRIEYYFSDFLSLMENEPDKREIKLVNVGLFRTEDDERFAYQGLTSGHTLKIPSNVWFIGTANRDESTFEISDKVYDRAHTMNFNKRAPKVSLYNDPIPQQFLPVDVLDGLFKKAQEDFKFDIDSYPAIASIEKLLSPYNISFGNRIAMQIERFVSIYCSCFTATESVIHTAVESIILSKVVAKLELKSVDNKEQLASEFKRLGFNKCSDFIMKLNED